MDDDARSRPVSAREAAALQRPRDDIVARTRSRRRATGTGARVILVTGAVGLVALGVSACTATGPAPLPRPVSLIPTASASIVPTRSLVDTVFSKLPAVARSAPAFTWDSAGRIGQGEASDGDDDVLLLAAACDGGGALTISINDALTVLDCSTAASTGPIDVTAAIAADAPAGVELAVRPTAGHPRYVAKAVSVTSAQARANSSGS